MLSKLQFAYYLIGFPLINLLPFRSHHAFRHFIPAFVIIFRRSAVIVKRQL
jgi:hypothetical protein